MQECRIIKTCNLWKRFNVNINLETIYKINDLLKAFFVEQFNRYLR